MKNPKGSTYWWDKISRWLFDIYSNWYIRLFFVPVALVVPPASINALYTNKGIKTFLHSNFPDFFNFIAPIGHEHVIFFNFFVLLYPAAFLAVGGLIAKRAQANGLNVTGLLALLASIDQIVGVKNTRFAKNLSNVSQLTKESAFEAITEPQTQIAEIVRSICDFFNATRAGKNKPLIRVALAVMKGNKITDLPVFFPTDEPIRTSIANLNSPNCSFIIAAKTKKMILISDISKELKKPLAKRKYISTENDQDNNGSIICHPIRTKLGVPYVISIHCEEPGYFKDEFKELYEHSLERFALRMNLEHSLLMIKEKLCG